MGEFGKSAHSPQHNLFGELINATGKYVVKYARFKELMSIPSSYETRDIDKQVLKPSILKLIETSPYTNKPYFENLAYKKIKENTKGEKGRGQSGAIDRIEFSFTPSLPKTKKKANKSNILPPPAKQIPEMKLKYEEFVLSM